MRGLIIIGIVLVLGIVVLAIEFGRYMYQRGFVDGMDEAARIMAEVRGVSYEAIMQTRSERSL